MRFSDLNCFVDLSCFKDGTFYEQALDELAIDELLNCLSRIEWIDGKNARHDAYQRLQLAAEQAAINGWIHDSRQLLPHEEAAPLEGMMIADFERSERAAILFALNQGLSLLETITLKRSDLRSMALTPAAAQIVSRLTPHLHCQWLFWYECNGSPVPLSCLPARWRQRMPMNWEHFAKAYHGVKTAPASTANIA